MRPNLGNTAFFLKSCLPFRIWLEPVLVVCNLLTCVCVCVCVRVFFEFRLVRGAADSHRPGHARGTAGSAPKQTKMTDRDSGEVCSMSFDLLVV